MSLQNLFIAKLPRNLTDDDLGQIFAEFKPVSAKVMLDASTGKSKGFGFVLFDSEEAGEKAFKALNRTATQACGHNFTLVIYPSNHDGKTANEESNALYIRNIPMSVPKDNVEKFLRQFGNLVFFALREDHYGSPVWVVYAEYGSKEDASRALHKLHNNNSYFYGSAPILAKYEDTDEAKRNRRKRREGAQAGMPPSSGCIFPPPRGADGHAGGDATGAHRHHNGAGAGGGFPMRPNGSLGGHGAGSPPGMFMPGAMGDYVFRPAGGAGAGSGGAGPGSFSPSQHSMGGAAGNQSASVFGSFPMSSAPPASAFTPFSPAGAGSYGFGSGGQAFSLPQHLLQPAHGYCYMLSDSGQEIFIPASSLSPADTGSYGGAMAMGGGGGIPQSAPAAHFGNMPQPQPFHMGGGNMPSQMQQRQQPQQRNGMSLLSPQSNAVVMLDDGNQFVLSSDTVNAGGSCSPPRTDKTPSPTAACSTLSGFGIPGNGVYSHSNNSNNSNSENNNIVIGDGSNKFTFFDDTLALGEMQTDFKSDALSALYR